MVYDVLVFLSLYGVVTVSFAGALSFLVGHQIYAFRSVSWSMYRSSYFKSKTISDFLFLQKKNSVALIRVSFGDGDFDSFIGEHSRWGLTLLLLYSLLSSIILVVILIWQRANFLITQFVFLF